jgi:hypothetical protein
VAVPLAPPPVVGEGAHLQAGRGPGRAGAVQERSRFREAKISF